MNILSVLYFAPNTYVGNSAAGFGEMVRIAIFSEALRKLFWARKRLKLAFRLDFLFLFHQGKRKEENNNTVAASN